MMKPTVTIFVCVLAAGLASAQSPSIIQNTRNTMNAVSNNATAASNEALGIHQSPPSAASATHAAAKSSGGAVVTPVKSSSPHVSASSAVAKKTGGAKKVPGVVAVRKAQAKPAPTVPKSNPPAAPTAASSAGSAQSAPSEEQVVPDGKYAANGRRDPFISPVVSHAGGSNCNTGKKCLEIGAINLRGVVRAESGFIAVVSNNMNKAYFLRENDPVFNGYVMKITGDSIVFQETLQDRLGKTFTREVVKKITTPAV
jgi:Tfp pilus assembly protein PilP